jgi:short-subunit dehydrogenase
MEPLPRIAPPPPLERPRRVVVIGATGTLGTACAERIIDRGDRVVLVARRAEPLAALADALARRPGAIERPMCVPLDLLEVGAATELSTQVPDATDAIVSFGSFPATPSGSFDRAQLAAMAMEHCAVFVEVTLALARSIDRARGAVVGFSDDGVERPYPRHLAYLAGKGALTAAMRALALELSGREGGMLVRLGLVAVGVVTDPDVGNAERGAALSLRARVGRTGAADEVAHVALALMDATWVSGEIWGAGR